MNAAFHLIYLACATGFVVGLHMMNSPATARRGNQVSAAAMAVAVGTTVVLLVRAGSVRPVGWLMLAAGAAVGGAAGLYAARTVAMTAMPQLVSVFNAVGGGAAALLAVDDLLRSGGAPVAAALDILIGAVTFSGSLVAAGKLQGWVPSQPIVFHGDASSDAPLVFRPVDAGVVHARSDNEPQHAAPVVERPAVARVNRRIDAIGAGMR